MHDRRFRVCVGNAILQTYRSFISNQSVRMLFNEGKYCLRVCDWPRGSQDSCPTDGAPRRVPFDIANHAINHRLKERVSGSSDDVKVLELTTWNPRQIW